jgi:hypothetical protein
MATPITFMLGTAEKVYLGRNSDDDSVPMDGLAEECALTVTYELGENENLEEAVKEKSEEIGSLHAMAGKSIRLSRAERKAGPVPSHPPTPSPPAQFKPPVETNRAPFQPNGSGERPLTGPQRLAIDDHFHRLRYNEEEVRTLLNARFTKSRVIDLSSRQASLLLTELQRMTVDPARANLHGQEMTIPVNGRRSSKRNGH